MTDLSGQYLGRYYLTERLGEGGMAVVYKAYDTRLERDVAVKIIRNAAFPPEQLDQILKRFEREAKSLAKLSHPSIVKVHDYGEHEGSPYLVMEYLPGGTLKKKLGKPIPWQDAVRLILPVARGVAYAHQSGILHRDIKPANILITGNGDPLLSDFGIAKLFEADQTTALTGSGMAIGTPEYMAPEQWNGVTSPQSDLYSMGIVLYEMVAGRKPYVADTPAAILIKQATEPLPSPRKFIYDLPESLELILIKALAKEPSDRYRDVTAFLNALEKLQSGVLAEVTSLAPETRLADKPPAILASETIASTPQQAPTALGGETIPAAEAAQPDAKKVSSPAPAPAKRTPLAVKIPRKRLGWLIVGVILVLAAWLSSPLIGKRLLPATPTSMPATAAPTSTFQPIIPTQTLELTPTESLTLSKDGVELINVPAGEFIMGGDPNEPYFWGAEAPRHQVYVDEYWIYRTEVTNQLYRLCVDAGKCEPPVSNGSDSRDDYYINTAYDTYPVIYVTYDDATAYCEWIGGRLPTEAEWEKAARGINGYLYPWGNGEIQDDVANFCDVGCGREEEESDFDDGYRDTAPVGSYPAGASPYGVLDMAGNVLEWVSDWYDSGYYSVSPYQNPSGPSSGARHPIRGGSWISGREGLRAAARASLTENSSYDTLGFRCAMNATP